MLGSLVEWCVMEVSPVKLAKAHQATVKGRLSGISSISPGLRFSVPSPEPRRGMIPQL
jgi:hypothetical protein